MMRRRSDDIDIPCQEGVDSTDAPTRTAGFIGTGQLGLAAIIVLGLIGWAFGIDPRALSGGTRFVESARHGLQYSGWLVPQHLPERHAATPTAQIRHLVTAVLAETQEVWSDVLPEQKDIPYTPPHLVLYEGTTTSACGPTFTAIGPFYCPLDKKIYLDTSFFMSMKMTFGDRSDFAYTYLLAHEVGHHVQDELGILSKAQRSAFSISRNAVSMRIELMADCFAGVWAAKAQSKKYHLIGPSDVEGLIGTANAIGDDRLELAAQGRIVPATFTHGTSAQRVYWFKTGLKSGQVDACDTFAR
ncbi:MAG: KPN_02809 family neutral zinc metallopeptidase [Methylovirgula sp.]